MSPLWLGLSMFALAGLIILVCVLIVLNMKV